jgi:hypothetical protein
MTGRNPSDEILTLIDCIFTTYPEPRGRQGKSEIAGKVGTGSASFRQEPLVVPPEGVVAEQVRAWEDQMATGLTGLADAAVVRALTCYMRGASVSEAWVEARRLVGSWLRHPSCGRRSVPGRATERLLSSPIHAAGARGPTEYVVVERVMREG